MNPAPLGLGLVVKGLKIRMSWPFAAKVWLKSPRRWSAVGTVKVVVAELSSRSPSYEPIKKVRSRRIGPLDVAPNWLRLKLPRGSPRRLAKKLLASKIELRRNS